MRKGQSERNEHREQRPQRNRMLRRAEDAQATTAGHVVLRSPELEEWKGGLQVKERVVAPPPLDQACERNDGAARDQELQHPIQHLATREDACGEVEHQDEAEQDGEVLRDVGPREFVRLGFAIVDASTAPTISASGASNGVRLHVTRGSISSEVSQAPRTATTRTR